MIRRAGFGPAFLLVSIVLGAMVAPAMLGRSLHEILAAAALCLLAAAIAIEDLRSMLIPDIPVLAIGLVGLGLAIHDIGEAAGIALWIVGAIGVAGALLAFSVVYGHLRGRFVLGFGDVKLVAASGLLIGPWGVGMQIFIASISAMIFVIIRAIRRGRKPRWSARVPFGTFLAPAAVVVWAWFGRGM